jgi:putative phosphoribosyl transferase
MLPTRNVRFRDRSEAGRELARGLERYQGSGAVVLGLARGGVPVAYEVADALGLSLDVFVVRKLGCPGQPELAMGAVASGGTYALNEEVIRAVGIDAGTLERIVGAQTQEVARRERAYRGERPALAVKGRTVILVDDGLATGSSMLAAVRALRRQRAQVIVVAVPVAPREACREIAHEADEVVCACMPRPFLSVGTWYADFKQTSDEEVRRLLSSLGRGVDSKTAG